MSDENEVVETEETVAEEVVEQVEETTEETTDDTTEEVAEETPAEEIEKPLPAGVVKRLAKMARQKGDLQREVDVLRYQAQNRPLAQPTAQPTDIKEPILEDFDFDDGKYMSARVKWEVEQTLATQQTQNAATQRQEQQNRVIEEFKGKVSTTVDKGVAVYEDFEEVAINNPDLFVTPQMAHVIAGSEIGHEIAYYLGSNTDEAAQINKLQPLDQAAAIARLEVKLTAKPVNKVTKAKAPINTVGAKGSLTTKLDPVKDWAKWSEDRNKQQFGR